jgi:hypothetical protein
VTIHALNDADNPLIKSAKWAGQVPADHPDGRTGVVADHPLPVPRSSQISFASR